MSANNRDIGAFICGVAGTTLQAEEREFLAQHRPFGVILFARNCENPAQVKALVSDIKAALDHPYIAILIDQEGGRVARLKPPHWRKYPPAQRFADLASRSEEEAARATYLNARLIAEDLRALGINTDCAPLADIPAPGSHDIIGDRAFGKTPERVIALARAQAQGLSDGGVMPILKHIPGHGRATADSHEDLPVVDATLAEMEHSDFLPFKALADLPMGMTAHILYTALDAERVATLSPIVIRYIRERIGFDGLLMSDDLSMKALKGDFATLAKDIWAAGCDLVLHCNGKMDEMQAVASVARPLRDEALARVKRAFASLPETLPESHTLLAEIETLIPDAYAA
jgi:beta-N-acetylhexosaminidase